MAANTFIKYSLFIGMIAFLFSGCQQETKQQLLSDSIRVVQDSIQELSSNHAASCIEEDYMNGKFYYSSTIRLYENDYAFIHLDSEYVVSAIKDKEIQALYFNTSYLTPDNREAYYKKIVSGIPKEDLRILDIVWKIKEIRQQAKGSDGGYLAVITLFHRPSEHEKNYSIEVRRDYYYRFGACLPMTYLYVDAKTHNVSVMYTTTGEMFSLEQWRKVLKEEN